MARHKTSHAKASAKKSSGASRGIWTGSISFGLLQIPVTIHTAEQRKEEVHFHLLDKRDRSRVRYQRISEGTNKPLEWKDIVKGYEIEPDEFVVIDKDDLTKANVKATKTIDIQDFVPATEIDPLYFETPYFLLPTARATKAYALLRDALRNKGAAAIATFVLRTREHLCALLPVGDAIVLEVLRFDHELRDPKELDLPKHSGDAAVSERELKMANQLIDGMMTQWKPSQYKDRYYGDIMKIIEEKAKTGTTTAHHEPAEAEPATNVTDLFDLLKRSLASPRRAAGAKTKRRPKTKKAA